jgi:serine/threonine protein kinase
MRRCRFEAVAAPEGGSMSRQPCPTPEALRAFVTGDPSETRPEGLDEHLESCPSCRERLARLDGSTDPVIRELRRGVPDRLVGSTSEAPTSGHPAPDEPGPAAPPPEQLDDFRIIREIGRGGMGVVYEAFQGSLNRHVANKMLPRRGDVARFLREAKAAGRLHHTNIVPVFGVGEHDGRHYYVMQFIRGRGLDEILKERRAGGLAAADPIDHREAARITLQVAEALAFAHVQGLIHRDVKPSNLLPTPAGPSGSPTSAWRTTRPTPRR